MTTGPDLHQDPHDRELADAWRAQSRESPPPALDAAILAAAHRAVGSTPRTAGADALRPPRWWMPFAAAAVIGVVAVGVVQLAPHDTGIDLSSGQGGQQEMAAAPAATMDASSRAAPTTATARSEVGVPPSTTAKTEAAQAAPEAASRPVAPQPDAAPAVAQSRPKLAAAPPSVAEAKPEAAPSASAAASVPTPASPAVTPPPTPPAPTPPAPAAPVPPAGAPAARVQAASPEPFPAATPAAPSAAEPSAAQPFSRDVPSRAGRLVPVPAELPRKEAAAAASSDATPAERLRGVEPRQMLPGLTGAAPMAKESVPIRAEALTLAKDPDAWIIRIRKLRDGGRTTDAVEELREFDALVPDAQQRMPSELRRFMERETVKR